MANPMILELDSYGAEPRPFDHEYWKNEFGFEEAVI